MKRFRRPITFWSTVQASHTNDDEINRRHFKPQQQITGGRRPSEIFLTVATLPRKYQQKLPGCPLTCQEEPRFSAPTWRHLHAVDITSTRSTSQSEITRVRCNIHFHHIMAVSLLRLYVSLSRLAFQHTMANGRCQHRCSIRIVPPCQHACTGHPSVA